MPGLSFVHSFPPFSLEGFQYEGLLDSLKYRADYERLTLLNETKIFLGATKHSSYPVRIIEDNDFYVCLDGVIYGHTDKSLRNELLQIAKTVSENKQNCLEDIYRWLKGADGEFVIFIRDVKNGNIHILNDLLGLLPCYFLSEKKRFIFSREISFLINLINEIRFDKFALAQHLIFDFTLGSNLFIRNVHRFPPATLITITKNSDPVKIKTIYQHNCEYENYADRSIDENTDALTELFKQACTHRVHHARDTSVVLGMSGGRDSRSVCSGLTLVNADFETFSHFNQYNRNAQADLDIAREVAQFFHVKWQKVEIPAPSCADVLELLKCKRGLNNIVVGYMITFLKTICSSAHRAVTYASGDHAASLKYYLPSKKFADASELADYIITHRGYMTPQHVAKLLNLKPGDITDHLIADLESFPERDFNRKFMHFVRYGYHFKWLYEGMDRNRCYTWLMSPLTSVPFTFYSLQCPQSQKKNMRLYENFLGQLSRHNLKFKLADTNSAPDTFITSFKGKIRSVYDTFPLDTKRLIKTYLLHNWARYSNDSIPVRSIHKIFDRCQTVDLYFNKAEIDKVLQWCSRDHLNNIFSLLASIELAVSGESVLEHYLDKPFS